MGRPISDLDELLASMEPVLNPGIFVFCSVPHDMDFGHLHPIATMRELEGMTLVVPEETALEHGLTVCFRSAWITLHVHSDLEAVGLTAAFAKALGDEGISCNVVAGAFHDHIFVPLDSASRALTALQSLQARSGKS